MKMLCNKKGITLLELIIAVGLVAIIAGAAYTVMLTGVRTFNRNIESTKAQSDLRAAMMKISKLGHSTTAVSTAANSVTFTTGGGNHTITASDGALKEQTGSNPAVTIAYSITGISATLSGKTLTVTLTGDKGATLTTQFYIE